MDSGRKGPLVMVVGGLHGDEPSGSAAALILIDRFAGMAPGSATGLRKGILVVVPQANPFAVASGARTGPSGLDMNRLFPGSPGKSEEDGLAIGIFKTGGRADLVIDLHEEGLAWPEANKPTIVINSASADLVFRLLEDPALSGFGFTGGAPEGSLVAELGAIDRPAFTVEVPARLPAEERIGLHLRVVTAALGLLGMLR
jgi:predicted deacylase